MGTVDEHLAGLDAADRPSVERIYAIAREEAPHPGIGLDKGTIRYQPEHPLSDDVVRALVLARKEQIDG